MSLICHPDVGGILIVLTSVFHIESHYAYPNIFVINGDMLLKKLIKVPFVNYLNASD